MIDNTEKLEEYEKTNEQESVREALRTSKLTENEIKWRQFLFLNKRMKSTEAVEEFAEKYILMVVENELEDGVCFGRLICEARTMDEIDEFLEYYPNFKEMPLYYLIGKLVEYTEEVWKDYKED